MTIYELTILHVEDDPLLAEAVSVSFRSFGFTGETIQARSVRKAFDVLHERARHGTLPALIIADMQLPDGSGLDLIRNAKSDPVYRRIPIIVLSQTLDTGVISEAYALGASSILSKTGGRTSLFESLQNFYQFWLMSAELPRLHNGDRLQEALERAIALRTRTAEFYQRLAKQFREESDEAAFWIERTLREGNLANLLTFFRNQLREGDVPTEAISRLATMQTTVRDALASAEECLQASPAPSFTLVYALALEVAGGLDEKVFAEVLGLLFPISSVATRALKVLAGLQMKALALHVRMRTTDQALLAKAETLLAFAERLGSEGSQR